MVTLLREMKVDRVVSYGQPNESQFSEDSVRWNRTPRSDSGKIAIDGFLRRTVSKYAACGWVFARMVPDAGMIPWHADGGIMPVLLNVQGATILS